MGARPTVVVVGANLAGGRAVETLRAEGFDGRIILIGDEPYRPYERPPLSKQILRGEWEPDRAFLQAEQWYADNAVDLRLGERATMLDVTEQTVLSGGTLIRFDALLLATGGTPRVYDAPNAALPGVHSLRTLDDAVAIRDRLRAGARTVIIGAGFIGVEVAASARQLGCEVTVVDLSDVPMKRVLGEQIGAVYKQLHSEHGVRFVTGRRVVSFQGAGTVEQVTLDDGATLPADLVVVGIGIDPNDELAREAGIRCENGIVVDERCMTSARGIFAAGDVAMRPEPTAGGTIRFEHWHNAQNSGVAAARAILGKLDRFSQLPWFWSDQYDVTLQMFGHASRWDRIVVRGSLDDRSFSAFYRDGEDIVAVLGLDRNKEVRAARGLVGAGRGIADDVLSDEGTDLRSLATPAGTPS